MIKLPFNNPTKAIAGILLVLGLFVGYNKCSATEIEVGPTFTGEFNGGVAVTLSERVFNDRIDVGVSLFSEQSWEQVQVGNNGSFWFAYIAERPKSWYGWLPSEVHIGGNYWFKEQPPINGAKEGFLLGLKWNTPERWPGWAPDSVRILHFSNAGTNKPNRGQDALMFGWRLR